MKVFNITISLFFFAILFSCHSEKEEKSANELPITQKRFIRKNAYSSNAQKDLESLEKALKIMKSKDCGDPLSWYYQGAIHWVPDTVRNNKLCSSYQFFKTDLKQGWDNCTHTKSGKELIHFLVWHRLYTYHFERIVRKLSGNKDFALPYWGYTDTVNKQQNRTMPLVFRDQLSSLHEDARFDSLNKGFPISGAGADNLSITKLNKYHFYYLYNKNMNVAPHGAMHDFIGYGNNEYKKYYNRITQDSTYGGLMEQVKSAAFDPIFWVHHSNVDRLWQQWTNLPNGQLVTLEELKEVSWPYLFFDETGKKVEYTIDDIIKIIYNMDYDYDDTKVYEKKQEPTHKPSFFNAASLSDTIINKSFGLNISKPITNLSIPNELKDKVVSINNDISKKGSVVLMSVTVSFSMTPKGSYQVYFNLPQGLNPSPENEYFSGFMTFFGANHIHSSTDHSHDHMHNNSKTIQVFTYEITPEIIKSNAFNKSNFNISIFKFNGLPKESITIESISLIKI
jgi:hypothetical protein